MFAENNFGHKETIEDYSLEKSISEFKEKIAHIFDKENAEKIYNALNLMIELHGDQADRPDGKPYTSHPLEVAMKIVDKYQISDPDIIIASLLHDSVEDQSDKLVEKNMVKPPTGDHSQDTNLTALETIGLLFGKNVQQLVASLSNPDFDLLINEFKNRGIEKTKNELYREHVATIIQNPSASIVKYADFSSNALALQNIPESPRKERLKNKYGPVITEVFLPFFLALPDSHPLYKSRDNIIQELKNIKQEQY